MNVKLKLALSNMIYAFTANGISMLISIIITLVVPKLLGIKEYSYWQLYIFYTSYVGFFHFGWIDGIYLKFGGKDYDELEHSKFTTQFFMLNIFEFTLAVIISIYAILFIDDIDKRLILIVTCICGLITIAKTYFTYIFELTNRIKEYALYTKVDRYIFFISTVIILLIGIRDYKIILLIDIIARFIALILCIRAAPEVVFGKRVGLKEGLKEVIDNISIGSKLMLANIASMLIIGIVRFAIEKKWDIETFGRVSLTLSISNFLIAMINAIGVVMFPMLRRTSIEKLPAMYKTMRTLLMIPLLAILIFYMPLKIILCAWLPKYAESIRYMALLFPIYIFECKMSLLINTYLKTLRKEKWILYVNIGTLILSLITTGITIFVMNNLILAVASIVILLAFRCILSEIILSRYIKMDVRKDILLESVMITIFMISSWIIGGIMSIAIYFLVYIIYLIIKRNNINYVINVVKLLLNSHK